MISQIIDTWKSSGVKTEAPQFTCKYCNKSFVKESTLTNHLCEKKRRYQQEKEIAVQWGLQAYLLFYNTTQVSTKTKNYHDFVDSPYYTAFVKFGRYCVEVKCINFILFTSWLLKNNKKLDHWCSDRLYEEWLLEYLRRESVQDALERSFKEMTEYAVNNPELKNGYTDYFRYGNVNRILHNISSGRISPWAVFNCQSGVEFIESLNEDQLQIIIQWINPDFWNKKFKDSQEDVQWTRTVLAKAGL